MRGCCWCRSWQTQLSWPEWVLRGALQLKLQAISAQWLVPLRAQLLLALDMDMEDGTARAALDRMEALPPLLPLPLPRLHLAPQTLAAKNRFAPGLQILKPILLNANGPVPKCTSSKSRSWRSMRYRSIDGLSFLIILYTPRQTTTRFFTSAGHECLARRTFISFSMTKSG